MNFVATKKSLSRQEVEKQYKKTVAIKNFMLRHNEELKQNLCREKEVLCRNNKSCRVIEFYHDRRKFGSDRN